MTSDLRGLLISCTRPKILHANRFELLQSATRCSSDTNNRRCAPWRGLFSVTVVYFSFIQHAPSAEDLTLAAMKRTPRLPSTTVGNDTSGATEAPSRAARRARATSA
jgi:hypothetical protein